MITATENVRDLFKTKGLRCTRQREMIYGALAAERDHPTAEDLFRRVRAEDPGVSMATVYNTLDAFAEIGLVQRLACVRGSGACRYCADASEHVHVVNKDGSVIDVPDDLGKRLLACIPPQLMEEVSQRMGVRVGRTSVQFIAE